IESYESGCGYFASVAHGLEGAVVGTLDASGIGGLAEGAAGLAGEEGSTAIEDALAGLEPGSSPGVYTVDSPEELQQIYDELSAGGKPTGSSYPGGGSRALEWDARRNTRNLKDRRPDG
ncbi:MAG: hypothetical protein JWN10_814, partial [Solirubrobacterales bacterium]|nr:hypothetical protein [Solirubrobacterales bacterium]